ncbi:MAG TPA: N-acetylmuramoyl-L-alanine amidase [Allosphingosinicella sp.]|nr:N-acetylmuramoyl-L-alanine amidase [Allosphingosinicella sp.]
MIDFIDRPSPNHDARKRPVSMIVLHYTDMLSAEEAITRLCDPEARVSCHYLVSRSGEVVRMVPEERRAWHAGRSYWRGITDVNDDAVGIELDNPGHLNGYQPFPDSQIDALIPLVSDIMLRHRITRGNVVGHSDVAPARKRDPGELFPWSKLARLRLALPRPTQNLMDPHWTDAGFLLALERFGYDVSDKMAAVVAFQRRFRPELIDGEIDGECRSILLALLLPKPMGDD